MTTQTDHECARIIEAHDTIAQEAHWGGCPDNDIAKEAAQVGDDLMATYKWAMSKAEARGKGYGLMAAYDALRERLSQDDRLMLLNMAVKAVAGEDIGDVK